jgi:hypothetical protein
MQSSVRAHAFITLCYVPFGVTYDKIGTIQRRLAWPLHKDDTLVQSGSATADNIFCDSFDVNPIKDAVFSVFSRLLESPEYGSDLHNILNILHSSNWL